MSDSSPASVVVLSDEHRREERSGFREDDEFCLTHADLGAL